MHQQFPNRAHKAHGSALENFPHLDNEAFVRLPVVTSLVGVGPASIWRWSKAGTFPKPIKVSPRVTVWRVGDVRNFLRRGA